MVRKLNPGQEIAPRVARRHRRARAEIVDAARAVLVEAGPAAVTIEAVAARAGISKPAIYYYFRSKDDVLDAVVLSTLEEDLAGCLEAVRASESAADAVVACLRATVAFYERDPAAAHVMFGHLHALGVRGETTELHANPRINELFDALAERIEADRAAGRVSPDVHPRRMAVLVRMMGAGIAWTWSVIPRVGTTSRHSLEALLAESERTLRAALATSG